ncbi:MAG: hypothetical protein COB71_02630 [Thiotrichales bacterium]|nr:MAG: hypothetical protein COB71_02630 [Thiotrichales bacterium]
MTKKIRVLQITHDLQIGGLQQVVVNICRTIDRERFEVVVLCLRELGVLAGDIEMLGVKVILLDQKESGTDYLSFMKIARVLKDEKIDVVHTHNTQPFVEGAIASIFTSVKAIVHTDHARAFPDKRRYMFAEWLVSHLAYKVVGVSAHTTENLHKYEKISKRKLLTIPNGIDETVYDIEIDKNHKKQELGLDSDTFIIGLGARLIEQKGISVLIESMLKILKKLPNTKLVIAGDGDYKAELKKLADDLCLTESVLFLGSRKDIPELLKIFDVYALPSYSEGLPMVILEAMASGCPVVATDVGGIGTAIRSNVNGVLVKPRNVEDLAEAIIDLLQDEHKRLKFSDNGKKIFAAEFSARKMIAKYEGLYVKGFSR